MIAPLLVPVSLSQSQTMNRDAQKRYAGQGLKMASMFTGFRGGDINAQSLQGRIDSTPQWFMDKATIASVNAFGDRDAVTQYPKFEMGDPMKSISSNADKIADKYKDDIDDM